MDIITAIFFASLVLLGIATSLDVIWTERGLVAGVAIEGDKLIARLFSTKPSTHQLALFNLIETLLVAAPATLGVCINEPILAIGGLGIILANAARHYFMGYLAWRKLLS